MDFLDDLRRRLAGDEEEGDEADEQIDPHALVPAAIPLDAPREGKPRTIEEVVLRATLIVVAVVVFVVAASHLVHVIVLTFVAAIIAAALVEPVAALEKRSVPTPLAIVAVYVVLLATIAIVAWVLFPPLIDQLVNLVERLPPFIQQVGTQLERALSDENMGRAARVVVDELLGQLRAAIPSVAAVLSVPLAVLEVVGNLGLALTISALLIAERQRAQQLIRRIAAPDKADQSLTLLSQARLALASYIRAQILIMASVAVGTWIGMVVLGVPFALPLAVLAFFAEAIPFVGPYISGVPIVAIALVQSPTTGLLMLVWIVAVQQIEGYLLLPAIQGRVLQVSPLIVLLAVLAGAALSGILGALLAVPLAAIAQIVAEKIVIPLLEYRRQRRRSGAKPEAAEAS